MKWQYKWVYHWIPHGLLEKANELGEEGWVMVNFVWRESDDLYHAFFKKPL